MTAKRAFDLAVSAVALVVLMPLFALVAVLIKLDSPGPVFFRQERVGRNGRLFKIVKFRTMHTGAEGLGRLLTVAGDSRITRLGAWLRRTKVDELPQLLNVLRGEMSLVGPRPEVPKYVALYTAQQRKVLEALPGITDPASIEFRSESDLLEKAEDPETYYVTQVMPQKLALNAHYLAHQGLAYDLVIIFRTLRRVVSPASAPPGEPKPWGNDGDVLARGRP